jgi:hypothetical protein
VVTGGQADDAPTGTGFKPIGIGYTNQDDDSRIQGLMFAATTMLQMKHVQRIDPHTDDGRMLRALEDKLRAQRPEAIRTVRLVAAALRTTAGLLGPGEYADPWDRDDAVCILRNADGAVIGNADVLEDDDETGVANRLNVILHHGRTHEEAELGNHTLVLSPLRGDVLTAREGAIFDASLLLSLGGGLDAVAHAMELHQADVADRTVRASPTMNAEWTDAIDRIMQALPAMRALAGAAGRAYFGMSTGVPGGRPPTVLTANGAVLGEPTMTTCLDRAAAASPGGLACVSIVVNEDRPRHVKIRDVAMLQHAVHDPMEIMRGISGMDAEPS